MRSSLRRASDIVLTGTRQRIEGFASSLSTPATVLFALGILLPMIIGSLLPMLSLGGFDLGLNMEQATASDGGSWFSMLLLSAAMMDIAFPMIAFGYARSILARRPGVHTIIMSENRSRPGQGSAHLLEIRAIASDNQPRLVSASEEFLVCIGENVQILLLGHAPNVQERHDVSVKAEVLSYSGAVIAWSEPLDIDPSRI